jgi:hypothetical protein
VDFVRMTPVNITVPDEIAAKARTAGLNVSRLATAALIDELDRRAKMEALDVYLAQLEAELGPLADDQAVDAAAWADRVLETPTTAEARPSA